MKQGERKLTTQEKAKIAGVAKKADVRYVAIDSTTIPPCRTLQSLLSDKPRKVQWVWLNPDSPAAK